MMMPRGDTEHQFKHTYIRQVVELCPARMQHSLPTLKKTNCYWARKKHLVCYHRPLNMINIKIKNSVPVTCGGFTPRMFRGQCHIRDSRCRATTQIKIDFFKFDSSKKDGRTLGRVTVTQTKHTTKMNSPTSFLRTQRPTEASDDKRKPQNKKLNEQHPMDFTNHTHIGSLGIITGMRMNGKLRGVCCCLQLYNMPQFFAFMFAKGEGRGGRVILGFGVDRDVLLMPRDPYRGTYIQRFDLKNGSF